MTNEDCIDSSYSSISSENELSLEDSSVFHSSSTSNSLSSYRIPSIIEIPSSFAPTSEEFCTTHNNGVYSCAPSKESSSTTADTHNLDIDVSSFEQHVIAASSDLESVNSKDYEVKFSIAKDGETTHGSESEFEFDFDEEAFESHLRNATLSLNDDFSCSTFETEKSSDSSSLDSISSIAPMYPS